jgi:hypothetical protein
MNRLSLLVVFLVVLLGGYLGLRAYSQNQSFAVPGGFQISRWNSDQVDELRFVFSGEKQLVLKQENGKWLADGFPADATRIQQVFDQLANASVSSRASTNPQNHQRFEVDGKGVTLTMLKGNTVVQDLVIGKTAGGDTVYARLPEQDDVFVLSGLQRHMISDDILVWRDRTVADFSADQARRVQYSENQIRWDLISDQQGTTLTTDRVAPVDADTEKLSTYLKSVVALRAVAFPSKEEQDGAAEKSTFAVVTFELGTPETFERKVIWNVYEDTMGRYLVIRDTDQIGFYVDAATFDETFGDYAQTKTKVTLTAEEIAAKEQAALETDK